MNEVELSNRTNNPKGDTKNTPCILKLLIETIDKHLASPKDFITFRTFSIILVLFSNHFSYYTDIQNKKYCNHQALMYISKWKKSKNTKTN